MQATLIHPNDLRRYIEAMLPLAFNEIEVRHVDAPPPDDLIEIAGRFLYQTTRVKESGHD